MDNKEPSPVCSIASTSKLLGDFWTILIIRQLLKGCQRFNDLKDSVENITNSTLSDRLKTLVENDLVIRNQHECIPPKVEYSLSEKGKMLKGLINEIESLSIKLAPN